MQDAPDPGPYVEVARAESERGELVLRRRRPGAGTDGGGPSSWELRANGVFVMDTLEVGTEQALAGAALALVDRPHRVLVGGLGLGFTMHQVLADPRVGACTVVEIEPALVEWMRSGTVPHGPRMMADRRLSVVVADVATALAETAPASYDVVLLDVDNGPGQLVHQDNAGLYRPPLLTSARAALRSGGALVVWSAEESPPLHAALTAVFDTASASPLPVLLQGREERYWLHVGQVRGARPGGGSDRGRAGGERGSSGVASTP